MKISRSLVGLVQGVSLLFLASSFVQAYQLRQEPLPLEGDAKLDCRECHWDVYLRWEQSAHGRGLSCGQCHLANQENHARQGHGTQDGAQNCMICHTTGYDPITDTWEEDNVHCTACHFPVEPDHPETPMPSDRSVELCGKCHIQARFEWQESSHGAAGVACVSCHSQHTTGLKAVTVSGQCASCHEGQTEGYSHSVHSREGLSCANCHLAPLDLPLGEGSAKRNHSFHVDVSTCVECHEEGLHAAKPERDDIQIALEGGFSDPNDAMASSISSRVSPEPMVGSRVGFVALGGVSFGVVVGAIVVGMAIVVLPWLANLLRRTGQQEA